MEKGKFEERERGERERERIMSEEGKHGMRRGNKMVGEGENGGYGERERERERGNFKSNVSFQYTNFFVS